MDFVISWVDDSDPNWQKEFNKYIDNPQRGDSNKARFRDWDNLHYWFRGVEKFAPWVDKIHFITWGHLPAWLNTKHPKLNIVNHNDFIPSEYLPTFNARTIELNFNKIKNLANEYVYFNDDMFLIDHVCENNFFKNYLPVDMAILTPLFDKEYSHTLLSNVLILNKYISDKRLNMLKKPSNWLNWKYSTKNIRNILLGGYKKIPGFLNPHLPQPLRKSTLDFLWSNEFSALDEACNPPFRIYSTVNQYLQRYWELINNNFYPEDITRFGSALGVGTTDISYIAEFILNQKKPMLCINDDDYDDAISFAQAKEMINNALNTILPCKSDFEL